MLLSALGMFLIIDNPSVNSGILMPLFVSIDLTNLEKVCCLLAIFSTKLNWGKISGVKFIIPKKKVVAVK